MNIIIDNREKDLKDYYNEYDNIKFENLLIGDIQINYKDGIVLIIERKTIQDFVSSLKDKRYSEQKIRLKENIDNNKILYLIEGRLDNYDGDKIDGILKKTITSTLISLLIKDNIKIYQTDNFNGTIDFISRIYKRLKENPDKLLNCDKIENKDYSKYIKLKKKDNITPEICYISQLSQIPGISNKIAQDIYNKYNSIGLLCSNYEKDCKLLENFEYEIKDCKKRKLGKKKNELIYKFLFNKIE